MPGLVLDTHTIELEALVLSFLTVLSGSHLTVSPSSKTVVSPRTNYKSIILPFSS